MPDPETVKLGDKDVELKRITARRGLTAATLLMPYVSALKPMLEKAAGTPANKLGRPKVGMGMLMETISLLAPILEPEAFLDVATAVTGIEKETLAEAPLEDVLAATLKAVRTLNLTEIVRASMGMFAAAG
jgi:hypothetical protein